MTTREEISTAIPIIDLVAGQIRNGSDERDADVTARAILEMITGNDDSPGPLDHYDIKANVLDNGKPLIAWYCLTCHHVGLIARNLEGDQAGLTLGEIFEAVLDHEAESHA